MAIANNVRPEYLEIALSGEADVSSTEPILPYQPEDIFIVRLVLRVSYPAVLCYLCGVILIIRVDRNNFHIAIIGLLSVGVNQTLAGLCYVKMKISNSSTASSSSSISVGTEM